LHFASWHWMTEACVRGHYEQFSLIIDG